jgi:hypothetical protein
LDGFIEGQDGEKDWPDSWASALELIPDVDTFVLGWSFSWASSFDSDFNADFNVWFTE